MMKLRQLLASLMLVALLVLSLAAFPSAPGIRGHAGAMAPDAGIITVWHSWSDSEQVALDAVVAAFKAQHPLVLVNVQYIPFDDLRAEYEAAVAGGGGPTVLIGASDWGPPFWDAGLVADLTSLADPALLATILPCALPPVRYAGALIGLPQSTKGVVLYRNSSIIGQAQTTYEDLVAAAQAATGGDILGAMLERGFFFAVGHLHGLGGQLMYQTGCPAFNDATGVAWVNLLDSFTDAGPAVYYTDEDLDRFKTGTLGYIIDGTWNLYALRDAVGQENLAIDPWPTPLSGYVQVENVYLNPNATGSERDEGWNFIEFFLSPEAQTLLLNAGHVPVVTEVPITDPLMQQALDAFAGGTAFPVVPELVAYWGPMDTALLSVFGGGADPAQALQTAYNDIVASLVGMGVHCSQAYLPLICRNW